MNTDQKTSNSTNVVPSMIGLFGVAMMLGSCGLQNPLDVAIPTEPAMECVHVPLDEVLPGITTKEKSYRIEQQRNDKQLIPGQRVSDFSLADLNGESVSLFDVLQEKEVVLIDFWASWCGPCVASFPTLKELRAEYGHQGFEVVAVSIDRTHEEWVEGSEQHEIPWINLGELESWDGEVATMYGVHFIPKSYLIDSDGCILQKDLPVEQLEKVIVSRFVEVIDEGTSFENEG